MSKPVEVTDTTFDEEIINSDKLAVVDFWAVWCGPCKMIAPIMEEFASEYEGKIKIAKVDVDNNPNIAVKYGIRSIPTVMFFKDGRVVDQVIGASPKSHFQEKIDEHI
jgi:thioredoxin 1